LVAARPPFNNMSPTAACQPAAPRTIAIGDIHGCVQALDAIVEAIQPTRDDRLVLLGDYVDRGPDSRAVIDRLLELDSRCQMVPLLGNHELMLLRSRESAAERRFWLQFGGRETLDSYGGRLDGIPRSHLDFFLRSCRLGFETESQIYVHANYEPGLELADQPESVLLWTHLTLVVPPPHRSGKMVVVGHTPQLSGEILDLGHLLCIDTFCVGGGWLTAVDVASRAVWQADHRGQLRPAGAAPTGDIGPMPIPPSNC
jgi:serine/threonine protein phosphatase 1